MTLGPIPNCGAWEEGPCPPLHHLLPYTPEYQNYPNTNPQTLTGTSFFTSPVRWMPTHAGRPHLKVNSPVKYSLVSADRMNQSSPVSDCVDYLPPHHLPRCQPSSASQTSWRQVVTYAYVFPVPGTLYTLSKMYIKRTNIWIHDHGYTFYSPITSPLS